MLRNALAALFASGSMLVAVAPAHAAPVLVGAFDTIVTGDTPGSMLPWATIELTETAAGVDLVFKSSLEVSSEFIGVLYLNLAAAPTSGLGGTAGSVLMGQFHLPTVTYPASVNGGGAGTWNLSVVFETNNSAPDKRFNGTNDAWFVSLAGLDIDDFIGSTCNTGNGPAGCPKDALIHIQGLENDGSTWASPSGGLKPPQEVPIPAAAWLVGSGLLAMGAIGRRRLASRA